MPRGRMLNEREKGLIEGYKKENVGIREISRRIGRSHNLVMNYLNNPENYGKRKRNPRRSKLTKRDKEELSILLPTPRYLLAEIKRQLDLNVSRETIRQVLVKNPNIKRSKMKRAPNLTQSHKIKRLEFAKTNMNRQWNIVSFA